MDLSSVKKTDDENEEEYVLLDLGTHCGRLDLLRGDPYVISGLDTLNPVLTIGDKIQLIGEYEETIGTCYVFSENEKTTTYQGTAHSDANLPETSGVATGNETNKQLKTICSLQKVLKFRPVE